MADVLQQMIALEKGKAKWRETHGNHRCKVCNNAMEDDEETARYDSHVLVAKGIHVPSDLIGYVNYRCHVQCMC